MRNSPSCCNVMDGKTRSEIVTIGLSTTTTGLLSIRSASPAYRSSRAPLRTGVQRVIRKYSLPWEVLFSLDKDDLRPTSEDMGITVRKADIEECWNVERMERAFGAEFRWRFKRAG